MVAVSDVTGGVHNEGGLDIHALDQHRRDGGSLSEFPGGEPITNDELLGLSCSVLIPAAAGDVITEANCHTIRADIILEGANHPLTATADAALSERGVFVLPDILANAGGVTVSYFEWTQNIQQFRWEEERVNRELTRTLLQAYHSVRELASEKGLTMRQAAYRIAVTRVAEAIRLRGFV